MSKGQNAIANWRRTYDQVKALVSSMNHSKNGYPSISRSVLLYTEKLLLQQCTSAISQVLDVPLICNNQGLFMR